MIKSNEEIKATELRIGNYVLINGIYCIVDGIDKDGNIETDTFPDTDIKNCEPIPLTEDILLKLGFEKYDNGVGFKAIYFGMNILNTDFYLRKSYKGGYYWGFDRDKGNEFKDVQPIKFVHSIQNLYYCLTNEELTFKE